ncbi:OmpP1/FadL family transporter [Pseudobacteriovorax antillogorgiicola]|uniref:Long-chain fatty acid transport protein n=1 Tax=Pseudobacteriovorax antillogorgiicola TaxID=1513793 RepID=A0A1Y6BIH5_9BACT|nr:outer membrane protein transport protein [Pseudobacteriovorax antillogorgiicola]TCS56415.1 long-subunit fatty acid transport protein [Pseudobacteriovorax antillogorgiicola]SMF05785.1 Long-chain fatty acid transport protein [Pseudobacteriovorax antillogorgiicola]
MNQRQRRAHVATALGLACIGAPLYGAGFGARIQSAQSLGTAYSAEGTGKDPSLIFSNPALIGSFKRHSITIGAAHIRPEVDFESGSRTIPGVGLTAQDTETSVSNVSPKSSTVPTLSGVHPITESVNIGWNVTVPFATSSDYGEEWVGRYHASETQLQVLNFDLAASYQLSEQWTFGFGVQAQRGTGVIAGASNGGAGFASAGVKEFQAALAAGGEALSTLTGVAAQMYQAFQGLNPDQKDPKAVQAAARKAIASTLANYDSQGDVIAEYKGDNLAYGYVAGLTFDPSSSLRFGLSYRSSIKHETEGDITLSGDNNLSLGIIQQRGLVPGQATGAKLDITLPDTVVFGTSYLITDDLNLYGNLTLTRWSTVESLNIEYTDINSDPVIVKLDWQDTLAYSIGGDYRLNDQITLRAGAAIDPTPTTDDLRSPRSPDNNRTVLSLGAGYGQGNWRVDGAFAHYIIEDPTLNLDENAYPGAVGRGNLQGRYSATVNTFMMQFGYQI